MASVLIVDDDRNQSLPLAALLRSQGHDADCADSAAESLRQLRHRTPDLLVVDVMMPETSGLEALDALTDEPAFADVRFAVFSGSDDPAFIAEAKRLGACDYIRKGQSWEEIYARLRPHLQALPSSVAAATSSPDAESALPQ